MFDALLAELFETYICILYTVGSLNADILRYNADIISATLKLWGKLDENVSWVTLFHLFLLYLFILSDKT